MEANSTCNCSEKHQGHICMLRSKGLMEDVAHLSNNPTVACFVCGAEANAEENVCSPVPL